MAYTPWTTTEIEAGKPVKEELWDKVKSNQEHFDTEIELLQGSNKFDIFDIRFSGSVNEYTQAELDSILPVFKSPVSGTIVSFVVTLLEASTSGTLQIGLEKSTDNGASWSSMLNNPVEVTTSTVGSISGSVDFSTQIITQNELYRIRVQGTQVDQGAFHVSIYGELS